MKKRIYIQDTGKYFGHINKNGLPDRWGKMSYDNGDIYEGEFENGIINGKGKLIQWDKTEYEGEFKNGKYHGEGILKDAWGEKWVGSFKDGIFTCGTHEDKNSCIQQGDFKKDKLFEGFKKTYDVYGNTNSIEVKDGKEINYEKRNTTRSNFPQLIHTHTGSKNESVSLWTNNNELANINISKLNYQSRSNRIFLRTLLFCISGLVIALMSFYIFFHNHRKVSLSWVEESNKGIVLERVKQNNGKWIVVDYDSVKIQIGEFDDILFDNGYNYTLTNFLTRNADIYTLYNIRNRSLIHKYKASDISFVNTNLAYIKSNNKYGFIDLNTGSIIVNPSLDWYSLNGNIITGKINNYYGILNLSGETIAGFRYDYISDFKNGIAKYIRNGETGFMNMQGNEISNFGLNSNIEPVNNGFLIKRDGLVGFATMSGGLILNPEYESIQVAKDDLLFIKKFGLWGVAKTNGQIPISCNYTTITIEGLDGYAKVKTVSGLYGWLNYHTGETIIEPQFEYVFDSFSNSFSEVKVKYNGQTIKIRNDGRQVDGRSLKEIFNDLIN